MARSKDSWLTVDRDGLAKVIARNGKAFCVYELIQNAWDEDVTRVDVILDPLPKERGLCLLTVKDDSPDGFLDLSHSFTLFAESKKKGNAAKRGVFNVGEKLVLALCVSAHVQSMTGTVRFKGGKHDEEDMTGASR